MSFNPNLHHICQHLASLNITYLNVHCSTAFILVKAVYLLPKKKLYIIYIYISFPYSCSKAGAIFKCMPSHFKTNSDINGSQFQEQLSLSGDKFSLYLSLDCKITNFSSAVKVLFITVLICGLEVGAGSLRQTVYEMKMFSFPAMVRATSHIFKSSALQLLWGV